VSNFERGWGALKSLMLMNDRFDAIDKRIEAIGDDLKALGEGHAAHAERIAQIEGFLKAATGQPYTSGSVPRLPK
jgi:hypothetical protein